LRKRASECGSIFDLPGEAGKAGQRPRLRCDPGAAGARRPT